MSYGVDVSDVRRGRNFDGAQEAFAAALPAHHLAFLRGTTLSFRAGDYFFCHAGVRPRVSLDAQAPQDLLWIREEFLVACGRL